MWQTPLNTLSNTNQESNEHLQHIIYPNPAENILSINSNGHIESTIFTLTGKKVLETTLKEIDVSRFKRGCYIVEVIGPKGIIREKLIIK